MSDTKQKPCTHSIKLVDWDECCIEYGTDGTAAVWQEGLCRCGKLVQVDYVIGTPHVADDDGPPENLTTASPSLG